MNSKTISRTRASKTTETGPPTIDELKSDRAAGNNAVSQEIPFDIAGAAQTDGYKAIMAKHLLLTLRTDAGLTLAEVAKRRGVTTDAARQAENRDYDAMKLRSLIDQIRAIGYDVDAGWLVEAMANHLPERTLHSSPKHPEPAA